MKQNHAKKGWLDGMCYGAFKTLQFG